MNSKAALLITLISVGLPAYADPLSAVDWLSDILETPQAPAQSNDLTGVLIEPVETSRLSDVQKDTVGLIPEQISGIPVNFWGDSDPIKLAGLIRNAPTGQLPDITAFWRRIILAEINPPVVGNTENVLLLARLDNLLTAGDLDPAEALLKAADASNPQLFRRWFDVSILTQRAENACKRMVSTPNFAPTLHARVFCLARTGDWGAASVTLSTGKALGEISPPEALLLGMFLDPEAFENDPAPPIPKKLTPLTFVMREALALPRPGQSLPMAFLHMDLQNKAGWKQRIISSERLVTEQSISPIALLDLYLEGSPSASGGVWDRVSAIQTLNEALDSGSDETLSTALIDAYDLMAPFGLQSVLAGWFAQALSGHTLSAEAKAIGFKLAVLNPNTLNTALLLASTNQSEQFIVSCMTDSFTVPPKSNLQIAIFNALTGLSSKTILHQDIEQGRLGQAVLSALTILHDGPETDIGDIEIALSVLSYGGFKDEAKKIAIQLLTYGNNA